MPEKYGLYPIEIAGLGKSSLSFDLISVPVTALFNWMIGK